MICPKTLVQSGTIFYWFIFLLVMTYHVRSNVRGSKIENHLFVSVFVYKYWKLLLQPYISLHRLLINPREFCHDYYIGIPRDFCNDCIIYMNGVGIFVQRAINICEGNSYLKKMTLSTT